MKKIILLFIVLIPLITNCSKDWDDDSLIAIRKVAWNDLSTFEKNSVTTHWTEAEVTLEKKIFRVRFKTNMDALVGLMYVYVDSSTKKVVGRNTRF